MDLKCCEDNEMKLLEVIKIDTMIKPRLYVYVGICMFCYMI